MNAIEEAVEALRDRMDSVETSGKAHAFVRVSDLALVLALLPSANGRAPLSGWKLVPVEPTERMALVGANAYVGPSEAEDIYCRMLSASPPPPEGVGGVRVCPHSDAVCRNGMSCPYSCATGSYDGTKRLTSPSTSGSDEVKLTQRPDDYLQEERVERKAKQIGDQRGDPNWWRFVDEARSALSQGSDNHG